MPTHPVRGKPRMPFEETAHRVHDYPHLVRRWRAAARGAGLRLEEFARQDEYPIYCVRTPGNPTGGGLYVSAGIHGDEPAAPEALLQWAEANLATHVRAAGAVPLFILPCLNPWGLVHNIRADHKGRDLNRLFDRRISPVGELRRLLAGRRFGLVLNLHEDYDAQGMYVYEVSADRSRWGTDLLGACASGDLPVERRRRIDGWPFRDGVLSRRVVIEDVPFLPEALYLYLHHAPRALTFETPSEFGIPQRVLAHGQFITECLERLEQLETKISAKTNFSRKFTGRLPRAARHV